MKAAIAACLALSTMASLAMADPMQPSTSAPMRLSLMQLDAVTAGSAAAAAIAEASALGFHVNVDTRTRTTVISNRAVEIAIAVAHACAVGESPEASSFAWTYSDGDTVVQRRVQTGFDGPHSAVATAFSITVARKQ
jgi:hypothetical protein